MKNKTGKGDGSAYLVMFAKTPSAPRRGARIAACMVLD